MPVRQRKEVQEMLRFISIGAGGLALMAAAIGASTAAIFPDQIGDFKKGPPETISVPDQALLDEFGLAATEQAEYTAPQKRFIATAWRFRDSTGAMAMFEFRRPPGAVRGSITKLAVQTSDGVIFEYGNYVFQLTGNVPPAQQFAAMYAALPKLEQSPLPALMTDLPRDGLVPNSERYVVGPVSLDRFQPGIPPSIAAFHLGSEAIVGKYQTPKGLLTLAIFNYPTPNIARDRYQNFQNISGAMAKRVGALVAVTIQPPDADAAERILSQVKYETNITWNEKVPTNEIKQTARFILDVFAFSGMLILVCLLAGLGYAAVRFTNRKMNRGDDPDAMITLHLGNK